jgi:glycosyltransferase involved in cell wall biosynthesis
MLLNNLRVAVVHEWLVTYAGAERVLEQILTVFPQAHVFSLIDCLPADQRGFLRGCPVTTSFIQKFPNVQQYYRHLLALFPLAIEQFDLTGFDLVISSQYCVSHGVITSPSQIHISYAHSPVRYAWDLYHQYMVSSQLNNRNRGWVAKAILHYIRMWDTHAAQSVDAFIANSGFVAKRIEKYYRRDAQVIHPPVDITGFEYCEHKKDYYLTASRMVSYKKIDLIVRAFNHMPDKKLVVIGEGPDNAKIRRMAGENIVFLGYAPFEKLKQAMQHAKAFVFAAEEDFGIVPLEAQACGTPVIAYGRGGALETVKGLVLEDMDFEVSNEEQTDAVNPTGLFFKDQSPECLIRAIHDFEANAACFKPLYCRQHALQFSTERFRAEFSGFVLEALAACGQAGTFTGYSVAKTGLFTPLESRSCPQLG